MTTSFPPLWQVAVAATALKVLLFPSYRSTDFEVHRNWLAITNSLPVEEWYYNTTSQWTLDYPPFFAYFEWLLSKFAAYADDNMVKVYNLEYDSWQTIYFQRSSVIVTELVLLYALHVYIKTSPDGTRSAAHAAALSIFLSPGLLIVDHIHFQYNGFMYGILVLSLVLARQNSTTLLSGILFAVLLCFKHIHLYLAPAYFVFLLRSYCLGPHSLFNIKFGNCIKLGFGIVAVFAVAFGPFAYWAQMSQLLSRLFPFSRGLCHAYWAPNIWALYSFVDRIFIYVAPRFGLTIDVAAINSVTRGRVGDTAFAVLPSIASRTTFVLTLAAQLPPLIKLFLSPKWETFIGATTLCAYASFIFGWHVHEKAILLIVIPFALICLRDRRYLSAFRPLAVAGHISLLPLLFTAEEYPIKLIYTGLWLMGVLLVFHRLAPAPAVQSRVFLLDRAVLSYCLGFAPLLVYTGIVHTLAFGQRFEFLPLMFTSAYCAVGVIGSWIGLLVVFFST